MTYGQLFILSFGFLAQSWNSKLKIKNSKLLLTITLLLLSFPPLSCTLGPGNFQSSHSTDIGNRIIRRIAVMQPESMSDGAKTKIPYSPPPVPDDKSGKKEPAAILSGLVYSTVAALPNWQIVSDREVREVLSMVPQGADSARARKLGELVYADAVISGRVRRYQERVGEEWGVKRPASVAFVLELWDVKRGDLIWSGQFDESQRPLSENIFALGEFTQRGGKWLTAEELTLEGVKKAVNQLHQILYRK